MQDPIIVNQAPSRTPRRSYTKEFKIDAVAQYECGDRSLAQVAMDLKINANLVRRRQKNSMLNAVSIPVENSPVMPTENSPL